MFTIYLYSFIGVYSIIYNLIYDRIAYFTFYWNWIYILTVVVFLAANLLRMYLLIVLSGKLDYNNYKFIDNSNECNISDYMELCECVMLSLCLIYFLQYLDANIVGPIFETLLDSFKNIVVFISSYCFIIIGFTFFGNFVYGIYILSKIIDYLKGFINLQQTCINLFFMIFGDYSLISKMNVSFPILTSAFVIMFGISVKYVV